MLIALYAAASLLKLRLPYPGAYEKYLTPAIGLVGGLLGGMSGMFAIPGVPYIQSLRLDRETMIQSIAIWFTVGALALMLALGVQGRLHTAGHADVRCCNRDIACRHLVWNKRRAEKCRTAFFLMYFLWRFC